MLTPLDRIMAAVTRPASDRTERYMGRVEAHLAGLPDDQARREFLSNQIEVWRDRYTSWAERVDLGLADDDDLAVSAFDFQLTLCSLNRRLADERADA